MSEYPAPCNPRPIIDLLSRFRSAPEGGFLCIKKTTTNASQLSITTAKTTNGTDNPMIITRNQILRGSLRINQRTQIGRAVCRKWAIAATLVETLECH
jgi:hypothetical protein